MKRTLLKRSEFAWRSASDMRVRNSAAGKNPDRANAWTELIQRHGPGVSRAIERVLIWHGLRPDEWIDDLLQIVWLRISKNSCKKLREWVPARATLGTFLATIGAGEALSLCRFKASRKEVSMDMKNLQRMHEPPDRRLSPEQTASFLECETLIKQWQANLTAVEQVLLRLSGEKVNQVTIGNVALRSQQYVSKTLLRLEKEIQHILRV